jgi:hypothetical protein
MSIPDVTTGTGATAVTAPATSIEVLVSDGSTQIATIDGGIITIPNLVPLGGDTLEKGSTIIIKLKGIKN